jgi:hypothetical protein
LINFGFKIYNVSKVLENNRYFGQKGKSSILFLARSLDIMKKLHEEKKIISLFIEYKYRTSTEIFNGKDNKKRK